MRLKSLEMQGFKSFPDKTVLTFGDGITAIVGPNGSGKSNISDAVRWVLGEQSTKTLRGSKMEDVIFGGTAKRNPVGYAEVSLTIDNSDGVLATEYSEVTITRRYYRSGDSEFYINRKMVRLRDIHELLMDTGLGRDGYSIIGQGRIDEILSLKSEDRREIFEEAAGISKFRHRKEEAERKLSATEDNLSRIRDIISELSDRVEPLRKQAEDAKEYLRIFEELKGLEIDLWAYQLKQNEMVLTKLKSDIAVATSQGARASDELDGIYRSIEEIGGEMRELDGTVEGIRERKMEYAREESDKGASIAIFENDKKNNLENIERVRREIDDEITRAGGIDAQIAEREEKVEELNALLCELNAKLEEIAKSVSDLLSGEAEFDEKLGSLQAERDGVANELNAAKIALSAKEAERDATAEKVSAGDTSLAGDRIKLEEVRGRLRELKKAKDEAEDKLNSAQNVLSGVALKKKSREEKLSSLTDKFTKENSRLLAIKHKLIVLNEMERDMEGFSGAVKFISRAEKRGELKGVLGTVANLLRVEDEYTTAIETILGAALQNVVVEDERAAKAGIALLKRENAGRVTFRPLTTIKGNPMDMGKYKGHQGFIGRADTLISFDDRYKNIFEDLLGRVAVVENINDASDLAKDAGFKFRIVTLDGQVINAGGSYTGGSAGKSSGILSRANEIEKISSEIESLEKSVEALKSDKAEAERELNKMLYDSEVYENEKREAEDELIRLEGEISHETALKDSLLESIDEREDSLESDRNTLSQTQSDIAELKQKIDEFASREESIKVSLSDLLRDNEELSCRREELNLEASGIREKIASTTAECGETVRARDDLVRLKGDLAGDNDRKLQVIAEYEQKNRDIDGEIEAIRSVIAEIQGKIAGCDDEIKKVLDLRLSLEEKKAALDRASKEKNEEIINLERERVRLEGKLEKADGLSADITARLWDGYELTVTYALGMAREIDSPSTHEKRISVLKGEKKKLGTVNLAAIEEYDEVSKRYEFLTGQAEDLETAKAELLTKIGDLTESMRDIFAEQFKVINENFSSTFTEIFGGGKAELSLENPEDILNCGIDIKVQPPGKSLRTITLLSGGERAFVAIALYFAIMKVRPTPFCVLDEIEAALDDVNVVRYANYLRKLTKTTQFIVITHRRGTMEEADVLYGVTMQDAGISKMLTISIAEVEHELKMKLK